jgi:hypothetical protein
LRTTHPSVLKIWNFDKNLKLTPDNVTFGTNKKVWWVCDKHKNHEWENTVNNVVTKNQRCPYCCGKKISMNNCLEKNYPHIAKEWHPNKNHNIKLSEVSFGSQKRVWWLCEKGHEWESTINKNKDRAKNWTRKRDALA